MFAAPVARPAPRRVGSASLRCHDAGRPSVPRELPVLSRSSTSRRTVGVANGSQRTTRQPKGPTRPNAETQPGFNIERGRSETSRGSA